MTGLQEVTLLIILAIANIPLTQCAAPSKFFWRPRLSIDLTHGKEKPHPGPKGEVVLVEAYHMSMTVIALAAGFQSTHLRHLNPISASFYTNAYRWSLRHMSLVAKWLGRQSMSYPDTHKVWRRRFYYMDVFVPTWIRPLIPFVSKNDWLEEEKQYARYVKYAEHTFGKHNRYPSSKVVSEEESNQPLSSESNPTP